MFFLRFLPANVKLEISSLALLAKGVMQKETKKGGMPEACRGALLFIPSLQRSDSITVPYLQKL